MNSGGITYTLLLLCSADKGDIGPEKYVEALMKQRGPYNPDQVIYNTS